MKAMLCILILGGAFLFLSLVAGKSFLLGGMVGILDLPNLA